MQRGEMVVKLDDIVLFSASGSYTKVYYSDNSTQVPSTYLGLIQEKLINTSFLRVHRSYLINLNKVKKVFRKEGIFAGMENGLLIEISRRNKGVFFEKIKSFTQ